MNTLVCAGAVSFGNCEPVRYGYDGYGDLTAVYGHITIRRDEAGRETRYLYDTFGNVIVVTPLTAASPKSTTTIP